MGSWFPSPIGLNAGAVPADHGLQFEAIVGASSKRETRRYNLYSIPWHSSHGHAPKPTVKQILGLASHRRSMMLGNRPQVRNRYAGVGKLAGVTDEPAFEVHCRYLEMKLQAEYVGPVSESLVRASFGVGQIYSPGRKIECVAVPMQNRPVLSKRGKARAHPRWRDSYRRETDFLDTHGINPCTKRTGDKLAA